MVKRVSPLLVLLFAALPLSAEMITKKFDFTPTSGIQRIDFEWNGIAVAQITWDLGDTIKPLRVSSATAIVRLDNNSQVNQVIGIALAVFDEQGNMVAAGSGGNKLGHLNKGERDEFHVRFPYVYRNLKNAKTFYLTLETADLSWKDKEKEKKASTP